MASLPIRFRPAAADELREAVEWYPARDSRVANRFCQLIQSNLEEVTRSPQHWPLRRDGTRQIRVKDFPYLIVILESHGTLHVIAVAHTSRRPGYWRKRLRDS